jgi:hypothetical protein
MMRTVFALCAIAAVAVTGASAQAGYNLPSATITMTMTGDCAPVAYAVKGAYEALGYAATVKCEAAPVPGGRRLMQGTLTVTATVQQTPSSPPINVLLQAANNNALCSAIDCNIITQAGGLVTGSSGTSTTSNAIPMVSDVTAFGKPFTRSIKGTFAGMITDITPLKYFITAGPSRGSVRVQDSTFTYYVRWFLRNDEFSYVATSQAGLFSNTAKVKIVRRSFKCILFNIGC